MGRWWILRDCPCLRVSIETGILLRMCASSQRPVLRLVLGQDVLGASQLFPQVGHLLPQSRVLLLQEAGADGDLVLLEPPRVPGPLRRQVVLPAPGPVFVILLEGQDRREGRRFLLLQTFERTKYWPIISRLVFINMSIICG